MQFSMYEPFDLGRFATDRCYAPQVNGRCASLLLTNFILFYWFGILELTVLLPLISYFKYFTHYFLRLVSFVNFGIYTIFIFVNNNNKYSHN